MLHVKDTHRPGCLLSSLTGHLGAGVKLLHSRGRPVLQAEKSREALNAKRFRFIYDYIDYMLSI